MVDAVREEPAMVLALKVLTVMVLARRVLVVIVDPLIPFVEILLDHMGALLLLVICMYPCGIGSDATVAILF